MIANRKSNYYLRLFTDLLLLDLSFFLSAVLAQSIQILLSRSYLFALMMALNFVWYFVSNVIDFYEDFIVRSFTYQFQKILRNILAQIITAVLFIFIVKEDLFTRNFILYYTFIVFILVSIRIQFFKILKVRIGGRQSSLKNALIIGAGELGKNFFEFLNQRPELGYNVIGFLDNTTGSGKNILGKITDLPEIINKNQLDEVIVALPMSASEQLDEIIAVCNRYAVRLHIIPDYFRFISQKYQISMIGDYPVISVRNEPLSEAHWRFIKRTIDIISSVLVIILVLSWLIPLIYILNMFFAKGPVFFVQERVGTKDSTFNCYKFRTMRNDNNSGEKYVPTVEGDPRITHIGKFLRKSNLDELPQFINILKGEMSLVGPRPHALAFNEIYKEMVDELKIRSWVKPGITGWAQVHGLRGDVPDYEVNKKRTVKRIQFDIWYIENWSIGLDIQIIMMTLWQMIKADTKAV